MVSPVLLLDLRDGIDVMRAARRVVLLGPPGCGKGTYAKHLTKLLSAFHISTGDLMRAEIGAGTELGKELESHTSRGQLVPDSLLFDLLDPILQKHGEGRNPQKHGSPRNTLTPGVNKTLL